MLIKKLKELWHPDDAQPRVGVHLAPGFVAIGIVSADGRDLVGCDFLNANLQDQSKALAALVERNNCAGSPAYIVLDGSDYEIRHTDAPPVEPEELAAALRFRLKDMVDIPFEQMAVAAQSQYSDRRQSQQPLALTGIARQERIATIVATVAAANLEPQAILMRETVLTDLAARIPKATEGIAIVYIGETDGLITICRGTKLGLARRHFTGSKQIAAASGDDSPLHSIATELQYSLDYHDGQLSTTPTNLAAVPPINGSDRDRIVDHLDQALPLKCLRLNPLDLFTNTSAATPDEDHNAPAADPATLDHCLLALASALPHPLERSASMYTPQRKRFDPFSGTALAVYLGGLVIALGLISLILAWRAAALEGHLNSVEEQRNQLASAISTLEEQRQASTPNPDLIAQRNRLKQEYSLLKRFMEQIQDIPGQALEGFSDPLKSLANQRVRGLWLTKISLHGTDISLTGKTLGPHNVAKLINQLAQEQPFAGRYFNELTIYQPEQTNGPSGVLGFHASTKPASEE